jgi:Ca-activated chloride channel family protein
VNSHPFTEDKAPLVIALDLSQTMDAIDLDPTRLERAKLKIRDLLEERSGARTALSVYAGTTHMVLPFTTDDSFPCSNLKMPSSFSRKIVRRI